MRLDKSGGDSQGKKDKHSCKGCEECEHRVPGKKQAVQWDRRMKCWERKDQEVSGSQIKVRSECQAKEYRFQQEGQRKGFISCSHMIRALN